MPDPVHAWAAVAPDGTPRNSTVRPTEHEVWMLLSKQHAFNLVDNGRAYLRKNGWRVVPVKIVPMERTDG